MPQRGIGSQFQLPNYIAQLLLDHNAAVHDALGIDHATLVNKLPYYARAYRNGAQAIPQNNITKILYNAETFDIGGNFDADGVDSDFLVPLAGYYSIKSAIQFNTMGDSKDILIYIYNNGGTLTRNMHRVRGVFDECIQISAERHFALNDVIDIRCQHNDANPRNISGDQNLTWVIIRFLGVS